MCNEPTSPSVAGATSDRQTVYDTDHDCLTYPAPLDCGDLAEIFRTNEAAAFRLLMILTPTQLNLQALAYAAYLNQLHCLDLDMDDILRGWLCDLGFDTR